MSLHGAVDSRTLDNPIPLFFNRFEGSSTSGSCHVALPGPPLLPRLTPRARRTAGSWEPYLAPARSAPASPSALQHRMSLIRAWIVGHRTTVRFENGPEFIAHAVNDWRSESLAPIAFATALGP